MNLQVILCDFELKIYICRKKELNKFYKFKFSILKYMFFFMIFIVDYYYDYY